MDKEKIVFKGSHPDSLYRVPTSSGVGAGKVARVMRALRWPAALFIVCAALAVFVYFLMPDNFDTDTDAVNSTYWETSAISSGTSRIPETAGTTRRPLRKKISTTTPARPNNTSGPTKSKTSEIDFYDPDNDKNVDLSSILESVTDKAVNRKLPVPPVFPAHITPEVQYGNEKADTDKTRTPKAFDDRNKLPEDTTLKPHITQKPEKPLAIYFKDALSPNLNPETISRAETINDYNTYQKAQATEASRRQPTQYKVVEDSAERELPPEIQEYFARQPAHVDVNFTSGHSKFFGIGIEDAGKMSSTTQSSVYNTRVSPTLPTWREGDDSTTKHYPVNLNNDGKSINNIVGENREHVVSAKVPQCRSPRLDICRGVLPYDLAGAAPTINGVDITTHLTQLEYLVSTNCSERARQFVCSLLEPECNPPPFPPKKPCYSLCKAVFDNCEQYIAAEVAPAFNCKNYESVNCMQARAPCYRREMSCGDGTCIPTDWVCDGTNDCPAGEDEKKCVSCDSNQYRCPSGSCIMKTWLCDGYLDCSDGEDENVETCKSEGVEVQYKPSELEVEAGEEPAGSAPAPSVHRPNKVPGGRHRSEARADDSSKELLMTSDSTNALKRNFTRRPSPSRLTPYRPKVKNNPLPDYRSQEDVSEEKTTRRSRKLTTTKKPVVETQNKESVEDINLGDLRFFDEFDKDEKDDENVKNTAPLPNSRKFKSAFGQLSSTQRPAVKIEQSSNLFERHLDGSALLRKAAEEEEREKARLRNITSPEEYPVERAAAVAVGSSHSSPCPSGELRCVDGLCITLAQLCDGTIDCSDHADEDNCYT